MKCDICERVMNYCFYINDEYWFKAVGIREGHWCAHCILEKLGEEGQDLDWYIVWNEPSERIMRNSRLADKEGAEQWKEIDTKAYEELMERCRKDGLLVKVGFIKKAEGEG